VHATILRETLGMQPDSGVQALARSLEASAVVSPVTLMKSHDVQPHMKSSRKSGEVRSADSASSVAVLPFIGMSESTEDISFARGLAEEVAHTLMRMPGLRLASHTSVLACHERKLDALQVARRLRVDWIIEGSVRRSADVLRIGVQLTAASSGYQVWSESYDRRTDDAFALQGEVAAAVAMRFSSGVAASGDELRMVIG
jgi:TolB-like protein